jgi:HPt (histidine-containing phosphotransfer) domain-containing protein
VNTHYSKASLIEIADGDEDFMSIVVHIFLEEIPPDIEALTEAIKNDNKELAYQFIHKIKPNIEMFGIGVQYEIKKIETWTRSTNTDNAIQESIDALNQVLYCVFDELKIDFPK